MRKGEVISRNFVIDELITDVNVILKISEDRLSIYNTELKRTEPAAFVIHQQLAWVDRCIKYGIYYKIKPR